MVPRLTDLVQSQHHRIWDRFEKNQNFDVLVTMAPHWEVVQTGHLTGHIGPERVPDAIIGAH